MNPGFTLIEILVALVILATAGIIVSTTVSNVAFQTHSIERRQIAHWIGEDHLTRMRLAQRFRSDALATGREVTQVDSGGRRWELRREVKATDHPFVQRVEVDVFEVDSSGKAVGPLDHQAAFQGRF